MYVSLVDGQAMRYFNALFLFVCLSGCGCFLLHNNNVALFVVYNLRKVIV